MTSRFTIPHLDRLVKEGKIRGYTVTPKRKVKGRPALPKPSKEKAWIGWNLKIWCEERGLELKTEHQFHKERKFRWDWSIPSLKLAVEYQGLFSEKSGHTTVGGYTKDCEKMMLAQADGWRVLPLTALNYKTLLTELNKCIDRQR